MELIQDEVLKGLRACLPQNLVLAAQQQLIQHLVVREQDVWRVLPNRVTVVDQPLLTNHGLLARLLPRIDRSANTGKPRVRRQQLRDPLRLVISQRVHRIQNQSLDPSLSTPPGTQNVVKNRVEECFRLPRPGSRSYEGRPRPYIFPLHPRRQPAKRRQLMPIRFDVGLPLQHPNTIIVRRPEGELRAHKRPLENPIGGIF